MTTSDRIGDEEAARLSRLWWIPLLIGAGWLVLAMAVLQFDITSVRTISLVFGVILVVAALNEAADVFLAPGWKWLHALLGVLFLLGGMATLVWPEITFLALANLIGWYLLCKGTVDVVTALAFRRELELWGFTLGAGILELVLAFWAVGYTGGSVALLVLWVGLGAVGKGIVSLLVAFQVRGLAHRGGGSGTGAEPPRQRPVPADRGAAAQL